MRLTLAALLALVAVSLSPGVAQAACPCSIWTSSTTPEVPAWPDNGAQELGVKFRSDQAGFIRGLRFYKGSGNTGTHVGNLWTANGTLLASATYTNETASGWQQVDLSSPVPIAANTTYVASYFTPTGFYAYNGAAFASAGVSTPPLQALRDGIDGGNGVYRYSATSAFPNLSWNSANYWVDIVFDTTAPDTAPPQVTARTPGPNATGVPVTSPVTATFNEAVQPSTITMTLAGPSGAVAGTTTYDGPSRTATFTPSNSLTASTQYTATVSGAKDQSGNTMSPVSWSFTTAAPPPPPPPPGSGSILLVTSSANLFGSYLSEILRAEGLTSFSAIDVGALTPSALSGKDVVVLGEATLTAAQVTTLTDYVQAGGNLIAMRPDTKLAGLLGITRGTGTRNNGYLAVNTAEEAAAGITTATMQYHGTADSYTLNGATRVASLYTSATAATAEPAVSLRSVGGNGGQAAAFTFDLARSVVYTRQGNPAWAGQSRDGIFPIRAHEMFRGVTTTDWVNLNKAHIPQADEQQRLLANLILTMNRDRAPIPRFWYFPRSLKAVVVGTGDDHGGGGTEARFEQYVQNSPSGCSTANWTCPRFTSYLFVDAPITHGTAANYHSQGFEVALHPDTGCEDFTDASLASAISTQLSQWSQKFSSLPRPNTSRTHCLVWSNWIGEPTAELSNGIRLDTNYYYWPGKWVRNRPGFMNGSGIPMRFARTTGAAVNVFQAATAMTDESEQSYPFTPNALLDKALGPEGYYGAFTTNLHTDNDTSLENDEVMASAAERNVPIVSAKQLLTWLDGRDSSTFTGVSYSGGALGFTVNPGSGATGLTGMIPTTSSTGVLSSLTRNGSPVTWSVETIKGIEYAFFPATSGSYTAQYAPPPAAGPTVSALTAATSEAGETTVAWTTNEPSTTEVLWSEGTTALDQHVVVAEKTRRHRLRIPEFARGRTYYYRVRSRDPFGRETLSPPAGSPPASISVPGRPTQAPGTDRIRAVALPDRTALVEWDTARNADGQIDFGTSSGSLERTRLDQGVGTSHRAAVTMLRPNERIFFRVTSRTPWGTEDSSSVRSLDLPDYGVADSRLAQWRMGRASGVTFSRRGDGEVRLADGGGTGTYVSRLMDIDQKVDWKQALWFADVPTGTRLTVEVRTGSTKPADGTWTPWTTVPRSGANLPAGVGKDARYIQYRLTLTGANGRTPVVEAIGFTSTGIAPTHPTEGEG